MDKSVFSNKPFLFILFTAFLSVMGIGLIIPVTPFIIAQYVDVHKANDVAWNVGLLLTIYSFCQFFAAPVLGALSDKYGRRPFLLFCLFGSAIGYVLFGIGGSLWLLFLSRIIDGITGGDISIAFSYVADVTKPQERGKYFGVIGATVGLGFILGPSLGGLVSHISLSAPVYLAAALTLLNMLYGYFVLPESLSKENRMSDFSLHHLNPFVQLKYILRKNILKTLMLVGFFYFLPFALLQGITSVFYKDVLNWTPGNLGLYFLILGIGDMFTQGFLTGKLLPKFGPARLVLWGFLIITIAFFINVILPFYPYNLLSIPFILLWALGSGLFEPSFAGLVSGVAEPHEQGRIQGASQSMQAITRILGPVIAAFFYQYNHSLPWVACVIFAVIGVLLLLQNKKKIVSHLHTTATNY
jgi:DHA1 family tetracycline resistance protein-like MFS transporter